MILLKRKNHQLDLTSFAGNYLDVLMKGRMCWIMIPTINFYQVQHVAINFFVVLSCHKLVLDGIDQLLSFALPRIEPGAAGRDAKVLSTLVSNIGIIK